VEHLIPQAWFDPLSMALLLVITGVAMAVLVKGADWLVQGAAGFAYRLGISKVIVGATVVSLGTTTPEAAVSVLAAWSGNSGLALGNAVGSVVADTGLIFGLGCLITVLPADRFVLHRQGWVQFGAAMLLAVLCYGAFAMQGDAALLGRWVGILLLVLLVGYMLISVRWGRQHPHGEVSGSTQNLAGSGVTGSESESTPARRAIPWLIGLGLVGLILVVFASRVLICSVSVVAVRWGVPQVVIAATLVAMGTSLPELTVGVMSIVRGHKELLVGNVIGADVLNVLFVIGASATAADLPIVEAGATVPRIFLYLHLPAMVLILVLFRLFIFSATRRGSFRRWFGLPLVMLYVAYVVGQFVISAGGSTTEGLAGLW
jgi:cation:H+ antiporter